MSVSSRLACRAHRALVVVLLAGVAVFGIEASPWVALPLPGRFFDDWLISVLAGLAAVDVLLAVVATRARRRVWLALGVGMSLYAVGTMLWSFWLQRLPAAPFPSVADAGWLALYPLAYATIVLLMRERAGPLSRSMWLDGAIAALASAALVGALVLPAVLDTAKGSLAAVITSFAYPVGDLLLVAGIVAGCALAGWRPSWPCALLAAGFLSFTAADGLYLSDVIAGSTATKLVPNFLWTVGVVCMALAAWAPWRRAAPSEPPGGLALLVPSACALVAVGLLVLDRVHPLDGVSLALADATIAIAVLRLAHTVREERDLRESRHQALTDELTSVANRRAFTTALGSALHEHAPERCAVLLLDLNGFKELNDTLGHDAGDELLRAVAQRLRAALRDDDLLARLGGDEFAVLVRPCPDTSAGEAVARKLIDATREPIALLGIRVQTGVSIGVACHPDHGTTVGDLLKRADAAMYRAKAARTGVESYQRSRDQRSSDRLALVGELGDALKRGQITAHYQPQVDPTSGQLVGVEALARWQHPGRGLLLPREFLTAIEHTNHSRALTLRMIQTAARDWTHWQHSGLELSIAVNLAAANFVDDALPGDIADLLRHHGMPAHRLCLEITETTFITDPRRALGLLHDLRGQGIRLSLDDFGSKHSSLAHLHTLPVDELKIDRSFVQHMTHDERTGAIVTATTALAHTLGLRAIAEGVEDHATLTATANSGCDAVQGFLFAAAMPADQLLAWHGKHTQRISRTARPRMQKPRAQDRTRSEPR